MRVRLRDGCRLFVDVDGNALAPDGPDMVERPVVLLLHGGPGSDHSIFKTPTFTALADVAQVVTYDHRGNGRSDPSEPAHWNLDQWADDAAELCDVLGIESPIVAGASFGGFVAQRLLSRHPDLARSVVLAGTCSRLDLGFVDDGFTRRGGPDAGLIARRFLGGDLDASVEYLQTCFPLYSNEPLSLEVMARVESRPEVLVHFLAEWKALDLRAELASVTCPVTVLAGEDDPIVPPEAVEELVASLPPDLVECRVEAALGHHEVCDAPFADAIRRAIG